MINFCQFKFIERIRNVNINSLKRDISNLCNGIIDRKVYSTNKKNHELFPINHYFLFPLGWSIISCHHQKVFRGFCSASLLAPCLYHLLGFRPDRNGYRLNGFDLISPSFFTSFCMLIFYPFAYIESAPTKRIVKKFRMTVIFLP